MKVGEVIAKAREAMGAKRVYGKPVEADGVIVIPAARVVGGAGGGDGQGDERVGQGAGAGFGLVARPVGAFVIKGERVRWKPAVDLLPLCGIVLLMILVLRSIVKIL